MNLRSIHKSRLAKRRLVLLQKQCATILCLEQANTVRFAMQDLVRCLFSIKTKRFEKKGFRDACVVQISCIEFIKVHVTSTLWTETQTTTEYYKTSSCINDSLALLDNSLYRACWPLLFFPPHSIFCTVYVWTSSQATVRSPRGKISPKMGFSRGCDDDAAEKGTRSMVTQIHWWRHTEPGTVWTSLS